MSLNLTKLLNLFIFALVTGLATLALVTNHAMTTYQIGSATYGEIVDEKDLIADILPPPLFVTEAYMLTLEANLLAEKRAGNADKVAGLHRDFIDRMHYWQGRDLQDDERRQLENGVERSGVRFWEILDQSKIFDAGTSDAERVTAIRAISSAFYDHRAEVVKLVGLASDHLAASEKSSAAAIGSWNAIAVTVTGVVIVLLMFGAYIIRTRAISPIVRITETMRKVAGGDLSVDIPMLRRRDEIGQMAKAVEVFLQACVERRQLEIDTLTLRERSEHARFAAEARAEQEAAQRLKLVTSGLARGLDLLAKGDFSISLDEPFSEDFEPLRRDFNIAVRKLAEVIGLISRSATVLNAEALDLNQASKDLSARTVKQAESLERTAQTFAAIATTVQTSASRTVDARSIAQLANRGAGQSAEIVQKAGDAMERIEERAREITSIIGVIDEIAFQTNLLALNAGVEAARAGDAGKGFAVVAQEVRALAQRSANAAKEIKALIQSSSEQVAGGGLLVRQTRDSLEEIVEFIDRINVQMDAISETSREQNGGLDEVTQAIQEMDRATQENAGMARQQTHSATRVAQEAEQLAELVSAFILDVGHPVAGRNPSAADRYGRAA